MTIDVDALLQPPTDLARRAREVAETWCTEAVLHHSLRSWVWARTLADTRGLAYDAELLYVAAMLHDAGVSPAFDAHAVAFETAGGAVAAVFAAGADWPVQRRARVREIIERHMWTSVDPAMDAEGYLLEAATSLDVAGADPHLWDADLLRAVTARVPRGAFSAEFANAIGAQAERKPGTAAGRLDASGRIPSGAEVWAALTA